MNKELTNTIEKQIGLIQKESKVAGITASELAELSNAMTKLVYLLIDAQKS
ncbi:hypothetical protein [Enterococcus avium]|uniref:hypothetical protein n=1 Tax=Enterococcus avium TaxID=33945 RepID=UPI0022E83C30|nr:hypothetical protein [Enterococcus avium]